MERGVLGRVREQHPQPLPLMGGQLGGVPAKPPRVLGQAPGQLGGHPGGQAGVPRGRGRRGHGPG